jgi:hypothetical protein
MQILYTQKDQRKNEMLSQEKLMDKIKIRAMEKIVYTRNQDPFVISLEELPPLIPKACRAETVEKTEAHKNSAFLKSSKIDGMLRVYMLHDYTFANHVADCISYILMHRMKGWCL